MSSHATYQYGNDYSNNAHCEITINQDVKVTVGANFEIEQGYDFLTINGINRKYSDDVPRDLSAGDYIHWTTDYSISEQGWELCFSSADSGNSL